MEPASMGTTYRQKLTRPLLGLLAVACVEECRGKQF